MRRPRTRRSDRPFLWSRRARPQPPLPRHSTCWPLHRSSYLRKLARSYNNNKSNKEKHESVDDTSSPSDEFNTDNNPSLNIISHGKLILKKHHELADHQATIQPHPNLAMSHYTDHGAEITDNEGAPPRLTSTSSSTSDGLRHASCSRLFTKLCCSFFPFETKVPSPWTLHQFFIIPRIWLLPQRHAKSIQKVLCAILCNCSISK